jgi:YbbR domain-containing protein
MFRLSNNWTLKLTSFIIAIALWGHVRGEVNPTEDATFRVKMQAPLPPASLIVLNPKEIPAVIKVTIKAPRLRLREIKGVVPPNPLAPADEAPMLPQSQMHATLDFSLIKPGKQTIPIKIVSTLEDFEDLQEDVLPKPDIITLEFAPAASAELKIEPQFIGAAVQNYIIENVIIVPRQARVFGPAESVAKVAHLRAGIKAPDQLTGELSIKAAPIQAVDARGRVLEDVRVSPETAAVSAMLREKTTQKQVPLSLKLDGVPANGFIVEKQKLSAISITVRGPSAAIKNLKEITAHLTIDGEKAPLQRNVKLDLPQGVEMVGKNEISATVQIMPEDTTVSPQPAATSNLPTPAAPG